MCGGKIGEILGGGDTPQVVRESPAADAAAADADARAKASTEKLESKRRKKASSLLATGGQGDLSAPATSMPSAAGAKANLGS